MFLGNFFQVWPFFPSSAPAAIASSLVKVLSPITSPKEYYSEYMTQKERRSKLERKKRESELEMQLYGWLLSIGQKPERQVKTKNHRIDIWLPGRLMLELKAGRVTGDDVCQAIDYYSTYKHPIVLIGSGMSNAASRGIEGFNKLFQDAIVFVLGMALKIIYNLHFAIKREREHWPKRVTLGDKTIKRT